MPRTVSDIIQMKSKEKITVLTGYDSTMATLCDSVDVILVGDSAGTVSYTHLTLPTIYSV